MTGPKNFQVGDRYGRLTALGEAERRSIGNQGAFAYYEKMKCDCGEVKRIRRQSITSGVTVSCGCLNRENAHYKGKNKTTHGLSKTRIYQTWRDIMNRCTNPNYHKRNRYGGRGIKVLWKNFDEFYNDMGELYKQHCEEYGEKQTTIDRIDNNGNYCKENCRWATLKEQANNRKYKTRIEYKGKEYSLHEIAELTGKIYSTVKSKYYSGIPIEFIIEHPNEAYHGIRTKPIIYKLK